MHRFIFVQTSRLSVSLEHLWRFKTSRVCKSHGERAHGRNLRSKFREGERVLGTIRANETNQWKLPPSVYKYHLWYQIWETWHRWKGKLFSNCFSWFFNQIVGWIFCMRMDMYRRRIRRESGILSWRIYNFCHWPHYWIC